MMDGQGGAQTEDPSLGNPGPLTPRPIPLSEACPDRLGQSPARLCLQSAEPGEL